MSIGFPSPLEKPTATVGIIRTRQFTWFYRHAKIPVQPTISVVGKHRSIFYAIMSASERASAIRNKFDTIITSTLHTHRNRPDRPAEFPDGFQALDVFRLGGRAGDGNTGVIQKRHLVRLGIAGVHRTRNYEITTYTGSSYQGIGQKHSGIFKYPVQNYLYPGVRGLKRRD